MNRVLHILISFAFFQIFTVSTVFAHSNDKPQPLEQLYLEIGYTTVEEAVNEVEKHFNQDLKMPLRVPPIEFTHYFGRFNDLEGEINDSLDVEFVSDKSPENHYKIGVRPIEHKIHISDKYVLDRYKLKNDIQATHMNISGFNVIVFDNDHWQYMLSIDKRVSDKVTPEVLVDIANSIK
ncbi:hypothetical protein [Cytobacillus sp. IB215665]|uniref:hypothetical protein n=1 Tax=Cytobacillus sp. IB215665 TaxID=3097357 RepID=UPI002A14F462|nr:hypothetical protein [Cytobacillus sp. IB215665]MDX8366553.1 hypothetical protein [Cytobacillus sp. IB215665]